MSQHAPEIKVKDLWKKFGEDPVLKGVSLTILTGKINFIIGRSGGGKSVLLKHLTALLTPDSGEIWYDSLELGKAHKKDLFRLRQNMGLLFQDGALFDSLSVGENISFPVWFHKTLPAREAKKRTLLLLEELGLEGAYHQRVGALSGGEKKRVALARALILEPRVIFFDEPTTGLDPILSTQVDELIISVGKRTGATVVVVSHDLVATLTIADQVSLIHEGTVVLSGPPAVFQTSLLPSVREFLAIDDQFFS
ncbi:MAG: ATP-binding cassette domain-containing protein [Deltaproteobacteria bacterium]|jgi:phospholipid/cholesterol/gamma-HCH transport system ATP-binding protein|nr:ATP-binding cassette domain-containing protein [Deltaproteobacteria bacterium]